MVLILFVSLQVFTLLHFVYPQLINTLLDLLNLILVIGYTKCDYIGSNSDDCVELNANDQLSHICKLIEKDLAYSVSIHFSISQYHYDSVSVSVSFSIGQ